MRTDEIAITDQKKIVSVCVRVGSVEDPILVINQKKKRPADEIK